MSAPRLSALVVSYRTAAFALAAVRSVAAEWRRAGRREEDLEVVVVDNAAPDPDAGSLEALERLGARVLRERENLGYARGMNRALEATRGGPRDLVAVLNPDLAFPPGSLEPLVGHLERHPEVGAVGPTACVDPLLTLLLPPNALPTPRELLATCLASVVPAAGRRYARRRLARALPLWTSARPLGVELLSGACLLLSRAAIERLGGLFDPRYPLYFEDTDLCGRARRAGLALVQHPVRVVHHWARSSGAGLELDGASLERWAAGRRAYLERFHGGAAAALVERTDELAGALPAAARFRPIHPVEDLGEHAEPVEVRWPRAARAVLELSMSPLWTLSAGLLVDGDRWCPRPETWEWFFAGRYHLRAHDRDSGAFLGAWSFAKPTPARRSPLTPEELEAGLAATPPRGAPWSP